MPKYTVHCVQSNTFTFDSLDPDFVEWLEAGEIKAEDVDESVIQDYISEALDTDISMFGDFDSPDVEVKPIAQK